MSAYHWENTNNLRVVKTLFDLDEITQAQQEGNIIIMRDHVNHPLLTVGMHIYKNVKTGEYRKARGRTYTRQYSCEQITEYPIEEWEEVLFYRENLRKVDYDFGAYVLPGDAQVGEKFYIENLIESVYSGSFWEANFYSVDTDATWDGEDLKIEKRMNHLVG